VARWGYVDNDMGARVAWLAWIDCLTTSALAGRAEARPPYLGGACLVKFGTAQVTP